MAGMAVIFTQMLLVDDSLEEIQYFSSSSPRNRVRCTLYVYLHSHSNRICNVEQEIPLTLLDSENE